MESLTGQGPPTPPRPLAVVHRCDRCFSELYEADRGFGSTSLACPNHGFQRTILEIPADLEEWARRNPETTRRYSDWLVSPSGDTEEWKYWTFCLVALVSFGLGSLLFLIGNSRGTLAFAGLLGTLGGFCFAMVLSHLRHLQGAQ